MDAAVIEVLQQAGSQDPNVLKPAEQTLREWETQRGFYTALFNVFSNHSLAINIRWMAILYFKNGVDRYWRKNAPGAIEDDEKAFLKQRLIASLNEPVTQLAVQLAVVIAKVARYDCPKEWETLVPTLLDTIRGQNSLAQHRALFILHHVVKSLASKRLQTGRCIFQELTMNVFNFILNLWNTYTESFLIMASNGADANQIQESLEKALLSLRILRKLIVFGFEKPSKSQDAKLFLEVVFERARASLECRKTLASRGLQLEVCEKFIIHLTKVLIGVVDVHPFCYIELIPTTLEFSVFYCFTEAGQALAFERHIIQCLHLIKSILSSPFYKHPKVVEDSMEKFRLSERAHQLKQEFFTPQILTEICSRLVTHYFLLTASDLELWDSDPENFAVNDSGEPWKYSLRPCTESLFLVIFRNFRSILASVLVDLIQHHHQPVDPNNLHAILLKDAVYNAVGLAAFDLYDEVNFDQWFSTTLQEELKIRSNNYRIIRRRVCWLIGHWSNVKLSAELRPELYKLMVEALSPEEDLGVRLAASEALKSAIDDFQFNPIEFAPYLKPAFSLLLLLLKDVKECDTMMRVLFVISLMVEGTGNDIKPHVGELTSYLPILWQHSQEHNMLRCAIVTTLVHMEKGLGSDGVIIQPLVVSVVALSCDVNQQSHVYLLDDGLELWLALLENAPAPTPAIMDLFSYMPALLERCSETLKLCLQIVKAYTLLSPQEFFSHRAPSVIEIFDSLLVELCTDGIVVLTKVLETWIKVAPQQGSELIKPLLLRIFERIYNGDADTPLVMTMYLCIAARVFLSSRDIFAQVISEVVRKIGGNEVNEEIVFKKIISTWINRMAYVAKVEKCKLLALALCSLLEANSPVSILEYFPQIIYTIVETLHDLQRHENTDGSDSLVFPDPGPDPPDFEEYRTFNFDNQHKQRKHRLAFSDPVHTISLKDMLQNQLLLLKRAVGDNRFEQLMLSLKPTVCRQLKGYISL